MYGFIAYNNIYNTFKDQTVGVDFRVFVHRYFGWANVIDDFIMILKTVWLLLLLLYRMIKRYHLSIITDRHGLMITIITDDAAELIITDQVINDYNYYKLLSDQLLSNNVILIRAVSCCCYSV